MAPTAERVQQIAAGTDPVVRNLRITQCYQDLSVAIRARIPGGANWCTFATWASKQAGQTIRGQDLENLLREHLEQSSKVPLMLRDILLFLSGERGMLFSHIRDIVLELGPLRRSSEQVSVGNQKVFAEIGLLFAQFLAAADDDAKFSAFLAALRPGGPPDGQDLLARAFKLYRPLLVMPAGKAKAEQLLLANLLVGLHEQTRLQPQIQGALEGAIIRAEDIDELLFGRLRANRGKFMRMLDWLIPSRLDPLRRLTRPLAEEVKEAVRIVITDHLMTLTFPPDRVLRLARDVPGRFPPDLASIANPDLAAELKKVDPTPGTPAQSGATDWSNFPERMHYIADLFRAFQEDGSLFDPPFTADQVAKIEDGVIPSGGL